MLLRARSAHLFDPASPASAALSTLTTSSSDSPATTLPAPSQLKLTSRVTLIGAASEGNYAAAATVRALRRPDEMIPTAEAPSSGSGGKHPPLSSTSSPTLSSSSLRMAFSQSPLGRTRLQLAPDVTVAVSNLKNSLEDGFALLAYQDEPSNHSPNLSISSSCATDDARPDLGTPSSTHTLTIRSQGFGGDITGQVSAQLRLAHEPIWCLVQVVGEQMLLVQLVPPGLSGVRRARAMVHGRELIRLLDTPSSFASLNSADQLTSAWLSEKLEMSNKGGPHASWRTSPRASPLPDSGSMLGLIEVGRAVHPRQEQHLSHSPPSPPSKDSPPPRTNGKRWPSMPSQASMLRMTPPLQATNDLKELQGRWSQSNATSIRDSEAPSDWDGTPQTFHADLGGEAIERIAARMSQGEGSGYDDSEERASSRAPSVISEYAVIDEMPIVHPIDKDLPILIEGSESSHNNSTAGHAFRNPAAGDPSWLVSGFDRVSLRYSSSWGSQNSSPRRALPGSRGHSQYGNGSEHISLEERERQSQLGAERKAFLRFQEEERQRLAEAERKQRELQMRKEDEKVRRRILEQLEAEQNQDIDKKRGFRTSSISTASSSRGPPPSLPLPPPPEGASWRKSGMSSSASSVTRRSASPSMVPNQSTKAEQIQGSRHRSVSPECPPRASVSPTARLCLEPLALNSSTSNKRPSTAGSEKTSDGRKDASHGSHQVLRLTQPQTSSTASAPSSPFSQALLQARRERRAIRQDGGTDGVSWVSKVSSKAYTPRELQEDDFDDLKARPVVLTRPYLSPHSLHASLPSTSWRSSATSDSRSVILAEKDLPQPPPMSPATATAFGIDKDRTLMSREELADDARRRALAVETAALEQIKAVRDLQKRLEFELSEVNRRGKERNEAEAAARARWARDQAQRNALDAFERSKLEHAEKQRRIQVEAIKREEDRRAAEVEREKRLAQEQERDAIQEARRRKESREIREQKLLAEVEAKQREKADRQARQKRIKEERQRLQAGYRAKLAARSNGPLVEGLLRAQLGEGRPWRTRFFQLSPQLLAFFKNEHERNGDPLERLDIADYVPDDSEALQDAFEYCQAPHSCLLHFKNPKTLDGRKHSTPRPSASTDLVELTIAFPSDDARQAFIAAFELVVAM